MRQMCGVFPDAPPVGGSIQTAGPLDWDLGLWPAGIDFTRLPDLLDQNPALSQGPLGNFYAHPSVKMHCCQDLCCQEKC